MGFVNEYSFKCLLGPQSKNIQVHDNLYTWEVGKKKHFSLSGDLNNNNIAILKTFAPSNFHYVLDNNLIELKRHFKVDRVKNTSIILNLKDISLVGNAGKSLRHCVNKCLKQNFELVDNYKKIDDVKKMIEEWSNDYTDKYFRDFSGKNYYFYKNNFHLSCINLFVYDKADLISFGTLSTPINGLSSYVIGKALYKRFYGLSEYTDMKLYEKAVGVVKVNMGQASKGLLSYKTKFSGFEKETHYDGSIKI